MEIEKSGNKDVREYLEITHASPHIYLSLEKQDAFQKRA